MVAQAQRLREVQQSVDEARQRNAARKLEKVTNRAWDSDKKQDDFDPRYGSKPVVRSDQAEEEDLSRYMVDSSRGRGAGRGHGFRGGRGGGPGRPPPIAKNPGDLGDPKQYPPIFT
jgi:hypothetical protein